MFLEEPLRILVGGRGLNTEFVFTYTFYFQIEDGRARKLMKLSLPVSRPFSTVRYLATSVTCLGEPLFAGSL